MIGLIIEVVDDYYFREDNKRKRILYRWQSHETFVLQGLIHCMGED